MRFVLDARDVQHEKSAHSRQSEHFIRLKHGEKCSFGIEALTLEGCSLAGHQEVGLFLKPHQPMYAVFTTTFVVQRYWLYYVRNVVMVLAIISFVSNMCFLFGDIEESIADRFEFISTILLTIVAFIFITSDYIPRLNYLTLLDSYIYCTFGYVLLLTIETALLGIQFAEWNDYWLLGANLTVWAIGHIGFVIKARLAYKMETEKLNMLKHEVPGGEVQSFMIPTTLMKCDGSNLKYESRNGTEHCKVFSQKIGFFPGV